MPEYAGFSTALISQYDAATIPESFVRVVTTPTLRSFHLDNIGEGSPGLTQHPDKTFSDLHKKSTTVIETYIPFFQSSQFWICYECPPPHQNEDEDDERGEVVRYYYFKLCYDGKCVLSWGVGEEDHWKGKTTFGLFDGGRDFEGKRIVEKRGLFYPSIAQDAEGLEIKIFRAKARRRVPVRYQTVNETTGGIDEGCRSLDLTSIGKVKQGERPKLLYTYALLDAKDEPWITFRYKFETYEDVTPQMEGTFLSTDVEDTTTASADLQGPDEMPEEVTESSLWTDLEQNTPPQQHITVNSDMISTTRRLSFPPRHPLFSSTSRAEPSSPIKQQASASDDDLTRPRVRNVQYSSTTFAEGASSRRTTELRKSEWTAVRGASPTEQMEMGEGEEVMPAHRKTASGSSGLLKSVVASALRRREERSR